MVDYFGGTARPVSSDVMSKTMNQNQYIPPLKTARLVHLCRTIHLLSTNYVQQYADYYISRLAEVPPQWLISLSTNETIDNSSKSDLSLFNIETDLAKSAIGFAHRKWLNREINNIQYANALTDLLYLIATDEPFRTEIEDAINALHNFSTSYLPNIADLERRFKHFIDYQTIFFGNDE